MTDELTRVIAEALAEHFTRDVAGERNPEWDIDGPDDETNPYFKPLTLDDRMKYGPYVRFTAGDGCRSMRVATFEEIAAAIAPLIEALVREARAEELEKFAGALDGQFPERSGSLMGRLVNPSIRQVAEVARTWAEEVRRA